MQCYWSVRNYLSSKIGNEMSRVSEIPGSTRHNRISEDPTLNNKKQPILLCASK